MAKFGETSLGNLNDSSSPEDDEPGMGAAWDSTSLTVAARQSRTSTRVSLLVEALVRSVVSAYETDGRRASRAYKKICRNLFQMGLIDESWTMGELDGARVQFEHALFQLLKAGPVQDPSSPVWLQGTYYTSQYKREFDELEKIGGGAFGKVFRVKHKLDGREYAVKKIPIYSEAIESVKNYLSEVKTLASLNHPNIVQYRAAWLELGTPADVEKITNASQTKKLLFPNNGLSTSSFRNAGGESRSSNFEITFEHSTSESFSMTNDRPKSLSNESKLPIPFKTEPFIFHKALSINSLTNNEKTDSNSNFEIAFEDSSKDISTKEKSTKHHFSSDSTPTTEKAIVPTQQNSKQRPRIRWATLYIQMALCHGTLDQWLRRRNEFFDADVAIMPCGSQPFSTKAIRQILMQILRGLEYIHSRGVVHHDIKPSNIFMSAEGGALVVQLGDFGLACPLQRTRHGFARGTPLYAAPEQLSGRCDPKSDLYSVGIVLFELLESFGTDMERTRRISELRCRTDPPVPSDFSLSNLVSALVRRRAAERPDASALLRALEGSEMDALEERLQEKEREIQRLKEMLRKHGVSDV